MLAESNIERIITLIDMEISHEELITTSKEKDEYKKMKENVRNISEKSDEKKQEHMQLNSVNPRKSSL